MIKTLSLFPGQCAQNSVPVLEALQNSCRYHGIQIQHNSLDSDAVVLWSVLWAGRMAKNKAVYQHYQQQGRPVIVVDVGALHRGVTWKISIGNVNALGYYGHEQDLDLSRPQQLGIQLRAPSTGQHIVVAAQHQASMQLDTLDTQESWINKIVTQLQKHTDRSIVVRPHPRSTIDRTRLLPGLDLELPKRVLNTYDDFDFNLNCHAVVNYSSGPGIQAALSGVRPVVSSASLAWPVAVSAEQIENPYVIDRQQWLVEICHTEYTLDEIGNGNWIKRLAKHL
jgi:hypothetical protein